MLLSKEEIEERVTGYLVAFPKEMAKINSIAKLISSLHHAQTQVHGVTVNKSVLRVWSGRIGLTLTPEFNNAIVKKDIEKQELSLSKAVEKENKKNSVFSVFNSIFAPSKSVLSKPYSQRMMHVHSG